jgi:hypothetical protein
LRGALLLLHPQLQCLLLLPPLQLVLSHSPLAGILRGPRGRQCQPEAYQADE